MNPRHPFCTVLLTLFLPLFLPGAASAAQLLAPSSFSAAPVSSSEIDLRWADTNLKLVQATETGYSIERSLSATSGFVRIGTSAKNVTTYKDTGCAGSTTYYYRVLTLGRNGVVSPYSIVTNATTLVLDMAAPIVSITSPASGTVYTSPQTVTITAAASDDVGVTKVEFYDSTTLKSTDTSVPYAHAWSFTSADNGTHYWTGKAYDAAGRSAISPVVSPTVVIDMTAPSVPTGLTASVASCGQINLSWTASSDTGGSGLAGYKIFRGGVQVGTANLTSYNSTGLAASTSYSFTVAAYDNSGNTSVQSGSTSATTPACADTTAPSVPTGLTASASTSRYRSLSWAASSDTGGSGLAGYKIFRGGVQVGTANLASYSSTGLSASASYSFTVAAY